MIVVKHASKSFGATRAVNDLSFALQPGHMTGLLGPNGAGKTTTIRMIAGYLTPDAGSITLAGHPVQATRNADPNAAKRNLGYLPESAPLYPELKPAQYLDYRAKLFGLPRKERRAAVARVLDRCRLTDMAHKRIGVLSKGYRQRVGLAAAIVHDPPVLILDEPTNGLDPAQMRSTRALIVELAEQRTVLLCTHVIPEVERACARVLVIAAGRLVADGPPDEVGRRAPAIHLETTAPPQSETHPDPLPGAITHALGPQTALAPLPAEHQGWVRLAVTPDPAFKGDPQASIARVLAEHARPVRHLAPAAAPLEERIVDLIDRAATGEEAQA